MTHSPVCLKCSQPLARLGAELNCSPCATSLIPAAHIEDMLRMSSPDDARSFAARLSPRASRAQKACPVCQHPMLPVTIEGVETDQCRDHGLWITATELSHVLESDSLAYRTRKPLPGAKKVPIAPTQPRSRFVIVALVLAIVVVGGGGLLYLFLGG